MRNRGIWIALLGTLAIGLVAAAPAAADTEYVDAVPGPNDTGLNGACSAPPPADGCTAQYGLETEAIAGDLVLMAPGTYILGADPLSVGSLELRGAGAGLTRITSGAPNAIEMLAGGSRVTDLEIVHGAGASTYGISAQGVPSTISRVHVTSTGQAACRAYGADVRIKDSVCRGAGGSGTSGIFADLSGNDVFAVELRNVTAYSAFAPGSAFFASASSGADISVDSRNSIFRSPTISTDIYGSSDAMSTLDFNLHHSAFLDTSPAVSNAQVTLDPNTANGNVAALPLFADAGTGDFHQLSGSPTIDAGTTYVAGLGDFDIDGQARIQGVEIDIGADEFVPPVTALPPGGGAAVNPAAGNPAAVAKCKKKRKAKKATAAKKKRKKCGKGKRKKK